MIRNKNSYYRNYAKDTYAIRSADGLCPVCGGKRDDGWLHCSSCRAKQTESRKKLSPAAVKKHKTDYRKRCRKANKCYCCGSQLNGNGRAKCETCRAKARAHQVNYILRKMNKH